MGHPFVSVQLWLDTTTPTPLGEVEIPVTLPDIYDQAAVRAAMPAALAAFLNPFGYAVPTVIKYATDGLIIPAAHVTGLATVATSGAYSDLTGTPAIPSTTRTTSAQSLSLVGTGATGTQISSTKDSTVRFNVSTSTTSTIAGPATSLVTLKKCSTNSATESDWTSVAVLENDQTISLALTLQSVQVMKGQLETDLPSGWYVKLVNSGSGTHSEAFISGEKTIYG